MTAGKTAPGSPKPAPGPLTGPEGTNPKKTTDMSNVKHIKGLPKPEPMTPEEKAEHVARFLSQQRISLTQGVAFNMMQNPAAADLTPAEIADKAVAVADALIERLFPIPEKKED